MVHLANSNFERGIQKAFWFWVDRTRTTATGQSLPLARARRKASSRLSGERGSSRPTAGTFGLPCDAPQGQLQRERGIATPWRKAAPRPAGTVHHTARALQTQRTRAPQRHSKTRLRPRKTLGTNTIFSRPARGCRRSRAPRRPSAPPHARARRASRAACAAHLAASRRRAAAPSA